VHAYNDISHSDSVTVVPSFYFYFREVGWGKDRWLYPSSRCSQPYTKYLPIMFQVLINYESSICTNIINYTPHVCDNSTTTCLTMYPTCTSTKIPHNFFINDPNSVRPNVLAILYSLVCYVKFSYQFSKYSVQGTLYKVTL